MSRNQAVLREHSKVSSGNSGILTTSSTPCSTLARFRDKPTPTLTLNYLPHPMYLCFLDNYPPPLHPSISPPHGDTVGDTFSTTVTADFSLSVNSLTVVGIIGANLTTYYKTNHQYEADDSSRWKTGGDVVISGYRWELWKSDEPVLFSSHRYW